MTYTMLPSLWKRYILLAIWSSLIVEAQSSGGSYSNHTLRSQNPEEGLEVVVYLPIGVKPTENTYYAGSRFEHGSMIGNIKRTSRQVIDGRMVEKTHTLFGDGMWRIPHNSQWPESGIGLASEYGVGDDGAFCQYRCGWDQIDDVTNGLLGYREARNGEPFLKIGVGALIKGSCQSCDSTDNYRFNSPYEFAELPQWHVLQATPNILAIQHEASLHHYGYSLHKDIILDNNVLLVTSTLTNIGSKPFSTAWYSHNFFTCDGTPIQEGYGIDLDIKGQRGDLYEEPGVIGSWASPLGAFATVREYKDVISVDITQPLGFDTRIKAEFTDDGASFGSFTLRACDTSIRSDFPEVMRGNLPMYAYNMYLERKTLSPEPQLLIHLEPGATTSWTQRLIFNDIAHPPESKEYQMKPALGMRSMSLTNFEAENAWKAAPLFAFIMSLVVAGLWAARTSSSRRRRSEYSQVPDTS